MSTGNASLPVTASAAAPPAGAPPKPEMKNAAAQPNAPSGNGQKMFALGASIITQVGSGFGVGTMLAKGNVTGTSLLVALASFVFVTDAALRYFQGDGGALAIRILVGTLLLTGGALIPYTVMAPKKAKGKGGGAGQGPAAAAAPIMAGVWILFALMFSAFIAPADKRMGVIQGSILSIMYMALSSVSGYNMQTKSIGTSTFAATLVVLLMIFDGLGFRRATTANASA